MHLSTPINYVMLGAWQLRTMDFKEISAAMALTNSIWLPPICDHHLFSCRFPLYIIRVIFGHICTNFHFNRLSLYFFKYSTIAWKISFSCTISLTHRMLEKFCREILLFVLLLLLFFNFAASCVHCTVQYTVSYDERKAHTQCDPNNCL